MTDDNRSLYSDPWHYDLFSGAYATGDFLEFYRRQVARYGQPVLEIACGSGRLTIPLAEDGAHIAGLDLSEEMLRLARLKAAERGVEIAFVHTDARNFDLGRQFKFIFVPANSFQHLLRREDVEMCLACVRWHLADGGRLVIDIFNPSPEWLFRDVERRYPLREREDPAGGGRISLSDSNIYDRATQINHIRWYFRYEATGEEKTAVFEMRQFYPQEIEALLAYNGFRVEQKYGGFDESDFTSDSPKQVLVCRAVAGQ